jgi:hypothetical protein
MTCTRLSVSRTENGRSRSAKMPRPLPTPRLSPSTTISSGPVYKHADKIEKGKAAAGGLYAYSTTSQTLRKRSVHGASRKVTRFRLILNIFRPLPFLFPVHSSVYLYRSCSAPRARDTIDSNYLGATDPAEVPILSLPQQSRPTGISDVSSLYHIHPAKPISHCTATA